MKEWKEQRVRKVRRIRRIILLVVLAVCFLVSGALAASNRWIVNIKLNDGSTISAEAGSSYKDPGATASYHGSTLFFKKGSLDVQQSGSVDTSRLGTYTITYTAEYRDTQASAERTVNVVDTQPPVIQLKTDSDSYTLPGQAYEEEGYTATDNYDGDLTDKVTSVEKDGKVYYSVTDSSGNTGTAERTIVYDDRTAPVITLNGGETVTVPLNSEYNDQYTAQDDVDGDVTANVTVQGSVDTSKEGTYVLNYSVKDAHGNTGTAQRTVIVKKEVSEADGNKLVYLTFDDGPGKYTERLLDILDKYQVKATFFVTNEFPEYQSLLKTEAERGHTVAVHTYSHDYKTVYSSDQGYWDDFDKMNQIIEQQTGKKTTLFRFPGGSSNTVSKKYSQGIMTRLTQEAAQKGYYYFDWNVLSGDAGDTRDSAKIAQNIIDGIQKHNTSVILCHDIHEYTVNAMDRALSWATQNGYTFAPLDENSFGAHQTVNN